MRRKVVVDELKNIFLVLESFTVLQITGGRDFFFRENANVPFCAHLGMIAVSKVIIGFVQFRIKAAGREERPLSCYFLLNTLVVLDISLMTRMASC
jgi:hypothetical protein